VRKELPIYPVQHVWSSSAEE